MQRELKIRQEPTNINSFYKKKTCIWYLQSQKDILQEAEIKNISHLQSLCTFDPDNRTELRKC